MERRVKAKGEENVINHRHHQQQERLELKDVTYLVKILKTKCIIAQSFILHVHTTDTCQKYGYNLNKFETKQTVYTKASIGKDMILLLLFELKFQFPVN